MIALLQRAEAALLWSLYQALRLLPLDVASATCGWIARTLGPHLPPSRRAKRNLEMTLPDADHAAIIRDMWENLGRIAGEFPHSPEIIGDASLIEVVGAEHLEPIIGKSVPAIMVTGHIGNWELTYPLWARLGLQGSGVYRASNNPHLAWLLARRETYPDLNMIPKGSVGARRSLEVLKKGWTLTLLVDQKMNDGIEVPFFGIPAMTAPALASLALKFGCPVIPYRILRVKGARFRAEFLRPIVFTPTSDRTADQLRVMTEVNGILEGWIRENPSQWLWLHRRWPKHFYSKN